jgi:hypothetical protein
MCHPTDPRNVLPLRALCVGPRFAGVSGCDDGRARCTAAVHSGQESGSRRRIGGRNPLAGNAIGPRLRSCLEPHFTRT